MHPVLEETLRAIQALIIICPLAWAFAALTYAWVIS